MNNNKKKRKKNKYKKKRIIEKLHLNILAGICVCKFHRWLGGCLYNGGRNKIVAKPSKKKESMVLGMKQQGKKLPNPLPSENIQKSLVLPTTQLETSVVSSLPYTHL